MNKQESVIELCTRLAYTHGDLKITADQTTDIMARKRALQSMGEIEKTLSKYGYTVKFGRLCTMDGKTVVLTV